MLERQWPNNRTINIVAHGHSVPAGYFKTPDVRSLDAYPHLLHAGLALRYPHAVVNVIVTAVGGEDSREGQARFAEVLAHRPDIVLIDYGLNDRRIGLAEARKAWVAMITQTKAHGAKVVLLTPTADLDARLDNPADPLNQHADQIRALAREYDVSLVDSLAAFMSSGGRMRSLMSQSNHPNRRGHELVADRLLALFMPSQRQEGVQ